MHKEVPCQLFYGQGRAQPKQVASLSHIQHRNKQLHTRKTDAQFGVAS